MDPFLTFKTYIEKKIGARLNSWDNLLPILELREYAKSDSLVKEGQQFRYELFLLEGVVRVFLSDAENYDVNIAFYQNNQVAAPYFTRHVNDLHLVNYQALTQCTVVLFDAYKFSELISKYLDIRNFAYSVVEDELSLKARKEKCFITQPASNRLSFFRDTYPGLENLIAQQHIASYLGISPVSLSRLRKA